jgi:type II secretion system (T2SS) protein F
VVGERLPGPLVLDLVAAVLAGGPSPPAALQQVGAALIRIGDPCGHRLELLAAELMHSPRDHPVRPEPGDWVQVLQEELALAMRSGLPPGALLRRAAEEQRRRSAAAQRRAVQRLEVLLVVPTGLCLLPAFVFLGIVPVVLGLLRV